MAVERYLIVNADDFGQSRGINRGITEAFERGIVTSASLMVRWPAAREAAEYGRSHPDLSLGLHFDICEWACRGGEWVPLYEVVAPDNAGALARELSRQLDSFKELVGKEPTHIDSHQHVHRSEPLMTIIKETAHRLSVPLRDFNSEVRYEGSFYGQWGRGESYPSGVSVERLIEILTALPTGVTELGCHPGYDDGFDSMYRAERGEELKSLCDPRIRATLFAEGIELSSFARINQSSGA